MTTPEQVAELVKRLRDGCDLRQRDGEKAADTITALTAEIDRLREYITKDEARISQLHRQTMVDLNGTRRMQLDSWVDGWIYEARAALGEPQ